MPKPFSRASASQADDASQRLVSSRCPECGAPIDFRHVPPDQSQVKCSYCGMLIAIPGRTSRPPTAPINATSGPTLVGSPDDSVVKSGRSCGAVVWSVIILLTVVGTIGVWSTNLLTTTARVISGSVQNDSSSDLPSFQGFTLPTVALPLLPKSRLATAPILLPGDERAPTQMVFATYLDKGSQFIGFDPVAQAETWRSPILGEKYYEMGVAADATRVYIADGASLLALDRATGQILWQTSLTNNIPTACTESDPCLQLIGDQIVALARDGTVQGFVGASGAPLWSRHLNSQPRQFIVNQGQVILVDNDASNRAVVLVLDGVTGDLIYELQPSCTFSNLEMRPHSSDQYIVTPDGSALIVVSSGMYACAWRYSLDDGTLTWTYTSTDVIGPLPFAWSMSSLTLADPVIYFTNAESDTALIYALDSQIPGATPQVLYSIDDYELTVQYPLGDLLFVSAQPGFARDEVELWAIDRGTGERRWQRKLETTHTFDKWVTRPTNQGIFVAVCFWNDDDCRFEVLDLATGTSQGQVRQATGGTFSGAAWRGNEGFLTIDGKLYTLDIRTATVEYTWP